MSRTLYWLQAGACSGDSMSLLNAGSPDLVEAFSFFDIDVLWHPSLANISHLEHETLLKAIFSKKKSLDILCVEGSVITGPNNTGLYDLAFGKPKKDMIAALAAQANIVVAVGTCSSFGGIPSAGEAAGIGLQFLHRKKGGLLGSDFVAKGGLPVINLPGCPCQSDVVLSTLAASLSGVQLPLNEFNSPLEWYGVLVHQGCTRNEYHEYRVEENDFGEKGCLFFHMGCQGPLVYGPCNKILWNKRNTKTRVGVPCFGCASPDFPSSDQFFYTKNIVGVPLMLPEGVKRANYLAYKDMAAFAAPLRLTERKTKV
jgi:NiFe hydrogenase small subunit HydA